VAPPPDGIPLINIATNGNIVLTELAGDLLVGHIHSTAGRRHAHVAEAHPRRRRAAFDRRHRQEHHSHRRDRRRNQGGIGEASDFLEINSSASATGAVNALDTASTNTTGIFLDELMGDLNIDIVHTLADVSLRTTDGSMVDSRNDSTANVLGRTIALDANGTGASIGSSTNDLDIDSRRGSGFDADIVALEAQADIYVTETDEDLRLLLAHAVTGAIRLTVRETDELDEHFRLIHSGHGAVRGKQHPAAGARSGCAAQRPARPGVRRAGFGHDPRG
jgi:hypothetical protein